MSKQQNVIKAWMKGIVGAAIIIVHTFFVIGLLNLYEEADFSMAVTLAGGLAFVPTIIAIWRKSENVSRILLWNILFFPLADLFVLIDEPKTEEKPKEDKFICESCNETFGLAEKKNKLLQICGLLLVYGIILYVIDAIPTNDVSNLLPRFILGVAFLIIAIVHILIVLFKETGRGKCPHCGSTDFISINSVKGQRLLKEIQEIRKNMKNKGVK